MNSPNFDSLVASLPGIYDSHWLAEGGQKVVYRARHTNYGLVAVKLILNSDSDLRALREVETSKTHFNHIPEVYKSDKIEHDGRKIVYVLEQYIEGETLRTRLDRGPLPVAVVVSLMRTLLEAASELQEQNTVHRDIKPANIMIGRDNRVWLLDLGIARHLDMESLTPTSNDLGPRTWGYAAPEQFHNWKSSIDSRTDLFAIGVVAYEALSGKNPFLDGVTEIYEIIDRIENFRPPILELPGDSQRQLGRFINALMDKIQIWRPRTAQYALELFQNKVIPMVSKEE